MPIALTVTRDDYTAAELRAAATRSNDADATRRMLALALVLEGYKRGEAGKLCGMDRQTLRDWVLRYNAEGIAGLCNRIAMVIKSGIAFVATCLLAVRTPRRWRRMKVPARPSSMITLAMRSRWTRSSGSRFDVEHDSYLDGLIPSIALLAAASLFMTAEVTPAI
jgi:Homeodomain-like domain